MWVNLLEFSYSYANVFYSIPNKIIIHLIMRYVINVHVIYTHFTTIRHLHENKLVYNVYLENKQYNIKDL